MHCIARCKYTKQLSTPAASCQFIDPQVNKPLSGPSNSAELLDSKDEAPFYTGKHIELLDECEQRL
jgi:hypothetical protein